MKLNKTSRDQCGGYFYSCPFMGASKIKIINPSLGVPLRSRLLKKNVSGVNIAMNIAINIVTDFKEC